MATSGDDDIASIFEAVTAVSGVSSVYAYDNYTSSTVEGIPANNIRVAGIGGTGALIAAAISNNKTCGVPTYGEQSESVYNTTTKQSKTIYYDVAVATETHISFTVTTVSGVFPDDGDAQLKAALVAHYADIGINDNVIYSALYNPIYSIAGITAVTLLKLEDTDPPTGVIDLVSTPLIRYTLATSDIDVTVA